MYDSMMAGIPIVCAFDAPDTLVKQFDCGIQCDPSDKQEVYDAICQLLRMSEEERSKVGERGKQAVREYYTYEKLANKFINLFMKEEKK